MEVSMKKILTILVCCFLFLGVVGCSKKEEPLVEPTELGDSAKFKQEYESYNHTQNSDGKTIEMTISEKNPIDYATMNEVLNLFENGTGILYFGDPTSPWCRNVVPILLDVAKNQKIEKIYYFNTSNIEKDKNYEKLKEYLEEYLVTNNDKEKVLYVPDVYFVKEGEIVGHHRGSVNSQNDPYTPLSGNQKNELAMIYENLLKNMK